MFYQKDITSKRDIINKFVCFQDAINFFIKLKELICE